ncbi:MAG TPA: VIT domain-containing protein [Kofleriaceae bacterium]|nr:VIT domain-containing protein [Kofleriaceae bacterium]
MMRTGATVVRFGVATLVAAAALLSPTSASAVTVNPGQGSMFVTSGELEPLRELVLTRTQVEARVIGFVGQVEVKQTFNNPFSETLEAIYVFPLPDRAAVSAMSIQIGERWVHGLIKRRDEAEAMYARARQGGRTAAVLQQERPNIFTQAVTNIEAGATVIVSIVYDVELGYDSGVYEFAYPMVVGPRHVPGTPTPGPSSGSGRARDTDRVPDGSRITPPVRAPGSRPGHDVTMDVVIDPGLKIDKIWSPTHAIDVDREVGPSPTAFKVSLPRAARIPNKDFVVRYRLARAGPATAVLVEPETRGSGGYFALLFEPPAVVTDAEITPRDLVFVVDTSGSMSGEPMALIKRAMRAALTQLGPSDTFQIVRFSDGGVAFGRSGLTNTPGNVRRGVSYLNGMRADGATETLAGLRAAVSGPVEPGRLRIVCLMTDGFTGDEAEILSEVERTLGADTRLFAFGIGSSPNRYLLDRLAAAGRGAAYYALLDEDPAERVAAFFQHLRAPVLTHLEIDWRGLAVEHVSPALFPDVFAGQPVRVVGHFSREARRDIVVKGRRAGKPVSYRVAVTLVPRQDRESGRGASSSGAATRTRTSADGSALARLWARARIIELMQAQRRGEQPGIAAAVTKLALQHGLISKYTSFIAVEDRVIDHQGGRRTVQVPVEMPEGVSYEGAIVGESTGGQLGVVLDQAVPPHDGKPDPRAPTGDGATRGVEAEALDRDADDAGYESALRSSPGSLQTISMLERVPGRWRIGLGVGAGIGSVGEDAGAAARLDLGLEYLLTHRLALGAELGVALPLFDTDDAVFSSALLELSYARILRGLLELSGGLGGALPSGGGLGWSYMGSVDLRVPSGRGDVSLRLRLDGQVLGDAPDLQTYTLGARLRF